MDDSSAASSLQYETIAIAGVGLIGGSIAAALKKRGFRGRIVGVGRSSTRLDEARRAGLIDEAALDVAGAAADSDLILFCTPVDRIAGGVQAAAANSVPGTLITDAGSVKGTLCRDLAGQMPEGVTFIGSHPLAGSEKRGFEHADSDLFACRVCVVTPDDSTPPAALQRLTAFWESLGMRVVTISAMDHDRALAETSHLPHVVASALAAALTDSNRDLAATGFVDTTRIAAGDPDLWTAILLANAEAVIDRLANYERRLEEFREAIANRDAGVLKKLLEVAKRNRDALDD